MATYLGRKPALLRKLAAGIHFTESFDREIQQSSFEKAIVMLEAAEKKMEVGLNIAGRNKLHPQAQKILQILRMNPDGVKRGDLLREMIIDVNLKEFDNIILELQITHSLRSTMTEAGEVYSI